jgi:AcrR family transcriptional regulator
VRTARRLFAERGYADVPAGEIVRAAGVTRGALYHHYTGKQDLFRAVFEELEDEVTQEIAAVAVAASDRASMAAALSAFLDICQRPEIMRIALIDAPAVLGWAEWRAIERRYGLGLIADLLDSAAAAGVLTTVPTPALAALVHSSIMEAALLIAHADDRDTTRAQAQQALLAILHSLTRA